MRMISLPLGQEGDRVAITGGKHQGDAVNSGLCLAVADGWVL